MRKQTPSCNWAQKYKDSRWQKLRLKIMERDNWTCRSCGKSGDGVTLNVHHAYYEYGKAPWEYHLDSLFTWCEKCHTERHTKMIAMSSSIARLKVKEFDGLFYAIYVAYWSRFFGIIGRIWNKSYTIGESALCSVLIGLAKQASDTSFDMGGDA